MKYCSNCVYPSNHPLFLTFNEKGLCSGCVTHQEKYQIDWNKKRKELEILIDSQLKNSHPNYDCVVPVSGSGDDFFLVHYLKKELCLNPLLVTYNSHFSTKAGIRNLARLITKLDCDHLAQTVGPTTVKEIVKTTLRHSGDLYWHVQAGMQVFAVQVAVKLGISLIFWPVNGWMDQVGKFSHHDRVEMTKKIWQEFSCRNVGVEYLLRKSDFLKEKDLMPYKYPDIESLSKKNVRGLYLNNFIFWDAKIQIEKMIKMYGYETRPEGRTFNTYETVNCWLNADVQDYLKYLKYGYSKIYDHASRDLRLGRLSRFEAVNLVKHYQDSPPLTVKPLLSWLGMPSLEFEEITSRIRNKAIWFRSGSKWKKTFDIDSDAKTKGLNYSDPISSSPNNIYSDFNANLEQESSGEEFILLGRSYLDEANFKAIEG